jgi:hypothetical protein
MKAFLMQAMTASAAADMAYGGWGKSVQAAGCKAPAPHNTYYGSGSQDDTYASAAKDSYAALWNPVAVRVGLPTIVAAAI